MTKIKIKNNKKHTKYSFSVSKIMLKNHLHRPLTKEEYFSLTMKDKCFPEEPEEYYKGQFRGWIDYLSIERKYYDLDTCKEKCKEYLKTMKISNLFDYAGMCEKLCLIDKNFPPSDLWCEYYNVRMITDIFTIHRKKKPIFLFE